MSSLKRTHVFVRRATQRINPTPSSENALPSSHMHPGPETWKGEEKRDVIALFAPLPRSLCACAVKVVDSTYKGFMGKVCVKLRCGRIWRRFLIFGVENQVLEGRPKSPVNGPRESRSKRLTLDRSGEWNVINIASFVDMGHANLGQDFLHRGKQQVVVIVALLTCR